MRKYIFTILIISIFILPFVSLAEKPIFVDGDGGTGGVGGSGGSGGTKTTYSPSAKSKLFVTTSEATNITYTTAILHGTGGDLVSNPTLPITAYFRYSKSAISPIFCNDIYGTNMISTEDINLGATSSKSFFQKISNLVPDTIYYYCAIVSNRDNIAYGGSSIVKEFHTSPNKTTVKTLGATSVDSNSAKLNGSYSSLEDVTTYFQYRKASTSNDTSLDWKKEGEETYKIGDHVNIYGNITLTLSNLISGTKYQFRAVAKNISGAEEKIVYGPTLNFTTSYEDNSGDPENKICSNGALDYPFCTVINNQKCYNGAANYPLCTITDNGDCLNGANNPPICTTNNNNKCVNGATNYPLCTTTDDGKCINGATNPPMCTTTTGDRCINRATNPPICTIDNNTNCTNGATNPPICNTTTNDKCINGATNYPLCTTTNNGYCTNGATNPPACTVNVNNKCINDAANYPTCTVIDNGKCINGATNPPTCTTITTKKPTNNTRNTTTGTSGKTKTSGTTVTTTNRDGNTNGNRNDKNTTNATKNSTTLTLGQTATPPADAIVRYHEGVETVFARQIIANQTLATTYGYTTGNDLQTFAWYLADEFAIMFGYVDENRKEIRVSFPDIAAYQLQLVGDKLTVYEYYDGKIVDIRNINTAFKTASDYEYYYRKN